MKSNFSLGARRLAVAFAVGSSSALIVVACSNQSASSTTGAGGTGAGLTTGTATTGTGAGTSSGAGGDAAPPPPPLGSTICSVFVDDRSGGGAARSDVLVTFAQPFKAGDVPAGATVQGRTKDGAGVSLQVDAKATHADGSLRHAIITARVASIPAGGSAEIELVSAAATTPGTPLAASELLATPFDTKASLALGGSTFSASARALLTADASRTWLAGPLVTEWMVDAPVADGNTAHPHLTAHFDVRAYAGLKTAIVSVTVENDWAYEPGPQNFAYDASIDTDAGNVFQAPALLHYHHARWRQKVVWGDDPKAGVRHDPKYLMATGAVPNFDPQVVAADSALNDVDSSFKGNSAGPMGIGLATAYMPETGGRGDIGPLPSWVSLYVISQDARAERATLGTADRAGSWSVHYRDKKTGRPVSLDDHPYMTLLGNPSDTCDPNTNQCDAFPDCGGDCSSPYTPDSAHQPSMAYVPYLLTGDRYYLEELQFWANWNMLQGNPAYRDHEKGLVHWDQVRGQGWSMRTLGHAAFITPDADPMKKYFVDRVHNNLAFYDQAFGKNPNAVPLAYDDDHATADDGTMAPWMDDFYTWSIGSLVDLGFDDAKPVRDWKVRYAIGRMTDPGYCWVFASVYHMVVEDQAHVPYATWADVYGPTLQNSGDPTAQSLACGSAEMGAAIKLQAGEMVGYSDSAEGYPSNLQPALAMAAQSGVANGKEAWAKFMSRSVKPDYSAEPQFAVVPR